MVESATEIFGRRRQLNPLLLAHCRSAGGPRPEQPTTLCRGNAQTRRSLSAQRAVSCGLASATLAGCILHASAQKRELKKVPQC